MSGRLLPLRHSVNTVYGMTEEEVSQGARGAALKAAIHVARERAGMTSDMQLARAAGISYDTLFNWFSERTVPRPAEMKKVADVLGIRLVELMDVYEGRDPQPPGIEERLGEVVDELRALTSELRLSRHQEEESMTELMRALGLAVRTGLVPRERPPETGSGARSGSRRST